MIGRSGIVSVEAALVALPLCLLIFGIIEVGQVLRTHAALQFATEQAARCASVNPTLCGDAAKVQQYAVTRMPGIKVAAETFALTKESCGKKVTASLLYTNITVKLIPKEIFLRSASCHAE